jgi:CelD/BcsL family acetyltransferase involved in cellulose biosynthesis
MNSPATSCFTAQILRTVDELSSIAPDWGELYRRCPDATPFQHPDWLLSWIEVFSPELRMIAFREHDRLIGLAPSLIYTRNSDRVLAFAGGGVSDYLNLLVEPSKESELFQQICQVSARENGWNILELTDVPGNSSLRRIPELQAYTVEHDCCSVILLPASQDELRSLFSDRQRANLRNARSRLQRAGGGEMQVATAENLPEFLHDLFAIHSNRWAAEGQPGVLADEQVRGFHLISAPRLLASGLLRLYRLRVEGRTAAVIYSLFDHGTVYCYLQGFDHKFSFLSPGTLLMYFVMEDAVRSGMRRFDFLRGREAYKQHWRPQIEPTFRICATHPEIARLLAEHARAA